MKSLERVERTAPLEMPRRMSVRLARTGALVALLLASAVAETQSPLPPERESVSRELLDFASLIENASLEPHWMADGRSFWFVEGAPAQTAIWVIDAALDHYRAVSPRRHGHQIFLPRIIDLRDNFTSYDAAYVALAEVLGAELATLDRGLAKTAARTLGIASCL